MSVDGFFFVDLETTGLQEVGGPRDWIIEFGCAVYDKNLDFVSSRRWLVGDPQTKARMEAIRDNNDFAYRMHVKSGLWEEWWKAWDEGTIITAAAVELFACEYATDAGVNQREPMCGSTISFDRERFLKFDMPMFNNLFGYRNIDASAHRELTKKLAPITADQATQMANAVRVHNHRSLADIHSSVNLIRAIEGMGVVPFPGAAEETPA